MIAANASKPAPPKGPEKPPAPKTLPFWRFFGPYMKEYRWALAGALVLNCIHGIAITFQTLMPKYLIDDVLLAGGIKPHQRWGRLGVIIGLYIFASLIGRMLVWHIGYRIFTYIREKVLFAIRATFFRHVNHLCLRFHRTHHSGELFSYLFGSPLSQIQNYFQQFTLSAPGQLFVIISTVIWVGMWDWLLTLVLIITVFLTVLMMQLSRKRIHQLHTEYQEAETKVTGYVSDLLRGSRDVKLYAMEENVTATFGTRIWEIGRKSYTRDVQGHIEWMKQEVVGYACFGILCVAIAARYFYDRSHKPPEKQVTIGQLQAYLAAFASLQGALTVMFNLSTAKAAAQAGVDRIHSVLTTDSSTPDPIGYEAPIPSRGEILFYNVTFGYEPDRTVLRNINLTIPFGQRVALVGPSGAGKSTITQLLLRFYDPDQGAILIGGLNIRHCRGPDLRHRFGVVPQDPFIFRTTLRENLCVARPDATEDRIRHACDLANASEFISSLPEGLDTRVGEGGSTLSGGQRQRLAIARALLADPDYFIFDEATSALDTVSEHKVQAAMEKAVNGHTALIIAHRLATVKNCDRILVISDGGVAEDGTYNELIQLKGIFHQLVQGQVLAT